MINIISNKNNDQINNKLFLYTFLLKIIIFLIFFLY